jgi:hypothetical protein
VCDAAASTSASSQCGGQCEAGASQAARRVYLTTLHAAACMAARYHNDFLWAKILLLHAENLFIDFGAES